MTEATRTLEIRSIPSDSPDHRTALHRVLGVKPPHSLAINARPVAELLHSAASGTVSIDLIVGAYHGQVLISAGLAVASPGSAAMVFVPSDATSSHAQAATVQVLRAISQAAWDRSITLLEVLLAPRHRTQRRTLELGGFCFLTRLRYLQRAISNADRRQADQHGLSWVSYSEETEPLFVEALEASYAQSMDCPELTGLRPTSEVLAGHRATGVFDPSTWWVAQKGPQVAGVVLVNRIDSEPQFELVYMGVAQVARGTGVANALLERAITDAALNDADVMALAVDERNVAARRVYSRWGFVETGVRDAWIASSARAG